MKIKKYTVAELIKELSTWLEGAHESGDRCMELANLYEEITGHKCYYDAQEDLIIVEEYVPDGSSVQNEPI